MPVVAVKMVPPSLAVRLSAKTASAVADVKPTVNNVNGSPAVAVVVDTFQDEKTQVTSTNGGDYGVTPSPLLPTVRAISVYDNPASMVEPDNDHAPMLVHKKAVKLVSWERKPYRSRGVRNYSY